MTKTDLFRVILKISGIYFLATVVFNTLPNLFMFFQNTPVLSYLLAMVVMLILAMIFLSLIFKPDIYIRLLKLDKGFDEEISNAKDYQFRDLLQTAVVVIGLWLIVKHLPAFITNLIFLFKLLVKNRMDISGQMENMILRDYIGWGSKIASLINGLLMVTNYRVIVSYLIKINPPKNGGVEL